MSNNQLNVLMLSYYFPPMGGAGVQRSLKFARYLTQFGISLIVITADEPGYTKDNSLLDELPKGLRVHRISHRPLMSRLLDLYRSIREKNISNPDAPVSASASGGAVIRNHLIRVIGSLQFPDDKTGWAKKAYKQAADIIEAENIDLIFSTSPPVSSHCVALKLKKKFGIPWIADFRDLWTDNPAYNQPAWRRFFDVRAERAVLASADTVVGVTHEMVELLGRNREREDVLFLPNGYDEEDFVDVVPCQKESDEFRIVYAGTFYGHQSPLPMLAAMSDLFDRKPELAKVIRLSLIGNVGSRFDGAISSFTSNYPATIERIGYLPHKEMLSHLLSADLQLLVIGGGKSGRGVLTGKIFEYLRAGSPILLVGPTDGEAANMLRNHQAGYSFDEDDIHGLSKALEQAVVSGWQGHVSDISIYDRKSHAEQIAQVMHRLSENHV